MALKFKVGVRALRIKQVLPAVHPDPDASPISSVRFAPSDLGRVQVSIDQGSTNLEVNPGQQIRAGVVAASAGGTADENYPFLIVMEFIVEVDGSRGVFYLNFDLTRLQDNPERDQYNLREAGSTVRDNGITIRIEGMTPDENSPPVDQLEIGYGPNQGSFGIRFSVVSSQLGDNDCSEEQFAFDPDKCECEPLCEFDLGELVEDCQVKKPLPPTRGCQDLPSLLSSSALILSQTFTSIGPPGPPGGPGPIGPMGPPGQDGKDGCNPIIIWSSQTVYTRHCTGPGFALVIVPFGPCFYWVHVITYICIRDYYAGGHCCEYIFCDGEWKPVDDFVPTYASRIRYSNLYALNVNNSNCTRGTLWSMCADDASGPGTMVGVGNNSNRFYYEMCAVEQPSPYNGNTWYNKFAEGIMDNHGDTTIQDRGTSPDCCLPPGGANTSEEPNTNPCDSIAAPTAPGRYPGEWIRICDCETEATTTCDEEQTIWSAYVCPGDPTPHGIPVAEGDNGCVFYADCGYSIPDSVASWHNVHPECLADRLGVSYTPIAGATVECCGPEPPCGPTESTTCDPNETVWTTLTPHSQAPDGVNIGHDGEGKVYTAICAVEPPDDGNVWINGDGYCYSQIFGTDFFPSGAFPDCCGDPPPCPTTDPGTSTTQATTTASTTADITDPSTTEDGPTTAELSTGPSTTDPTTNLEETTPPPPSTDGPAS